MFIWLLAIVSVIIISLVSLIGAFALFFFDKKSQKSLTYLISFSAGGLFGDTFIHLIPEAIKKNGFEITVSILFFLGIVISFTVERLFQWRHCHIPTSDEHPHSIAYMNLFGDAFHNFLDGLIIGGSYIVSIPLGISTTIAVIFHEIPQELGDIGVLIYGGMKRKRAMILNMLTALTAVLGSIISLSLGLISESFIQTIIPFAAGNFIYIAGSDLIPEISKDDPEPKKETLHLISIIAGFVIMLFFVVLE